MVIELILKMAAIYLLCGVVFAIVFIAKGLKRTDDGGRGSSAGFKIIIIPGVIIFWPVLLRKWMMRIKGNHHD
jgi:hypothetical protein